MRLTVGVVRWFTALCQMPPPSVVEPGEGMVNVKLSLLMVLGVVLLGASGCMVRRAGLAGESQRVIRESARVEPTGGASVVVAQEGTRLRVEATRVCHRVAEQRVEHTLSYGREISSPPLLAIMSVAALGSGAFGGLFVANVFEFPSMSSPGGGSGITEETALLGGVLMLVVSAVATALSLGSLIRVVGTDDEITEETVYLGPQGRAAPCSPAQAFSGGSVRIGSDENAVELGVTDGSGTFVVDVSRVVEPRFVYDHPSPTAAISFAGRQTDTLFDLGPLRVELDNRVWARAEATRCAAAEVPADCQGIDRYVQLFPSGVHVFDARAIQVRARERLAERAERAEEQRRLEEEHLAQEAENRRIERERANAEYDRLAREQQERRRREQLERERSSADRRARTQAARERRTQQAQCRRDCGSSCGGNSACVSACVQDRCR